MADTAVVNSKLTAYDSEVVVTFSAATATAANATEIMAITPTRPGSKCIILITEGGGTTDSGALGFSIGAGTSEHFGAGSAATGSVARTKTEAIVVNTARFMQSGAIDITLTPATGDALLTDHAATVACIELPFK